MFVCTHALKSKQRNRHFEYKTGRARNIRKKNINEWLHQRIMQKLVQIQTKLYTSERWAAMRPLWDWSVAHFALLVYHTRTHTYLNINEFRYKCMNALIDITSQLRKMCLMNSLCCDGNFVLVFQLRMSYRYAFISNRHTYICMFIYIAHTYIHSVYA